jgi:hypothetical protein
MAIQSELTADFERPVTAAQRPVPSAASGAPPSLAGLIALYRPRAASLLVLLGYLTVMLLMYAGWQQRLEWPLTAESGAGYLLGILGGVLMLLLLLYPLRKHSRLMRRLGPVKGWFRMHMLFGVLGPLCILFHCGFQFGSLNSNVALLSMLIVAGSGLIGRYFYVRIHHGLYGKKATLKELQQHTLLLKQALANKLRDTPQVLARIERFESTVFGRSANALTSLWRLTALGLQTRWLYLKFRFSRHADNEPLRRHIGAHLASIRKVAGFQFYERLFSIWHLLHLPLFVMLILSGFVHVLAVHMY